jgi:hypothetical protein
MKKKLFYAGGIGLIIIVFLLVVAARCLGDREVIPRPFTAFDLLIGEDALPIYWQVDGTPVSPLGEGDEDDSYVVFIAANSDAMAAQTIYRLPSRKTAESVYDTELPYLFRDESIVRDSPWQIPDQLSYVSPYTNRQHMACTTYSSLYICQYLAQYEEFVTVFSSYIDERVMTLEQFNGVVQQIDQRFAQLLQLSPLSDNSN